MTLLTIIQTAADRLSIRRPTAVVTSTDQQVRQLFALANEEGEALSKRGFWQTLTEEHTFITSASEEQTNNPIPTDLRDFIPNSFFNRSQGRRVVGPLSTQQYQALKAFPVYGRIYLAWRRRQDSFLISPAPPAGDTIAYEYRSRNWAKSDAAVGKQSFTADSDGTYLDEELIIQGLKWRYKHANGLEYGEDLRTYELTLEQALAGSIGAGALSQGIIADDPVTDRPNVPEGGFGL